MGMLFKRHSMMFPNDERVLEFSIYRDDMISNLMHGDVIRTNRSGLNEWTYDETIPLNDITYWKGKKVYDFNYILEVPVVSYPVLSSDNKFFRFDITYSNIKFLQFIAPTDALKTFFYAPVNFSSQAYIILDTLAQDNYVIKDVLQIKLLSDQIIKHGKDGEGKLFESYLGFNAFVDLNIDISNANSKYYSRNFILKVRLYLKSFDKTLSDDIKLSLYRFSINDIVKDTNEQLKIIYRTSNYIS
jgi:hypothetical protein